MQMTLDRVAPTMERGDRPIYCMGLVMVRVVIGRTGRCGSGCGNESRAKYPVFRTSGVPRLAAVAAILLGKFTAFESAPRFYYQGGRAKSTAKTNRLFSVRFGPTPSVRRPARDTDSFPSLSDMFIHKTSSTAPLQALLCL